MSAEATLPIAGSGPPITASRRDWIAVFGGVLGAFMAILDIQITNSALKDIQGGLSASLDEGSWISTSYLVAEIVVIPMTAYLSRVFGLRRYLLVNSFLFVCFSILAGLSTSLTMMILARAMQGFTGGVLIPTSFTINVTRLPEAKRSIGMALFGFTATFAPAIGPTLGGWLTDTFGWEYIFFINVIPGAVMMSAIAYGLGRQPMSLGLLREANWTGIALMAVGLGSLEIVLEEGQRKDWFGSNLIVEMAMLSVVTLTAFVLMQLTMKNPLIDLRLLLKKSLGSATGIAMVLGLGLFGSLYVMPVYLAQIQGYNAMQIGEVIMWVGLPQLILLPFLPRIMAVVDARILVGLGLVLFATSCMMNGFMTHETAIDQLRLPQIIRAMGQPLVLIPLSSLAITGLRPDQVPSASALFNISRNLGGSIGIALLSTFITQRETYHFSMISEHLRETRPLVSGFLANMGMLFSRLSGPEESRLQAVAQLRNVVRREAFVMAYSDAFLVIGAFLAIAVPLVFLLAKPRRGAAPVSAE